jgi:hypothetical protein
MDTTKIFRSNREATLRMKQLIQGLSDAQMTSVLFNGWTVSVTLAHLAFWDQRVSHVIEMAKKEGRVIRTELDIQLNDIIEPFLRAIPPVEAARLALSSAETLDQQLEACSPETIDQLEKESPRWVDRSLHRNSHLEDIEAFIKK